jgi:TATA-box binding protein (TBP) (component of TFIID and TFIIIB)
MHTVDKDVHYSVVFLGEIITGFEKNQVLNNLSIITRLKDTKAEEKFFNSGNVVIKRTTDIEQAKRYQNKFLRAGMAVGIQMEFEQVAANN